MEFLEFINSKIKLGSPSFSEELFRYIREGKLSDVDVYKRAQIDRKLFAKIRNPKYNPSKRTAVALALALELKYEDALSLLNLAGYTLSSSISMPFDIIIINAIQNRMYEINKVNEVLYKYELPLL